MTMKSVQWTLGILIFATAATALAEPSDKRVDPRPGRPQMSLPEGRELRATDKNNGARLAQAGFEGEERGPRGRRPGGRGEAGRGERRPPDGPREFGGP